MNTAASPQVDAARRAVQWFFMSRLSRFLLVRYARDSVALLVVTTILVWLTQMLRIFDLVTAKGQSLFTLAGQGLLTTPPLAREIAYICMAVGLARAFKALQDSRELHSIHILQRVSAIWGALVCYILLGMLFVSLAAHWVEPAARAATQQWKAQIAAELVGQNLTPGRFTEVAPGVVVVIGGRRDDGTVVDFFADDSRDAEMRRTYFADEAIIILTDAGFQISLRDGRLQFLPAGDKYSEIEFARYELAVDSLTEPLEIDNSRYEQSSWSLFADLQTSPEDAEAIVNILHERFTVAPRVAALSLLVAALLSFPHARRSRGRLPIELVIMFVAFGERGFSNALGNLSIYGEYAGPLVIFIISLVILVWRFRGLWRTPPRVELVPAT